MRARRFCLAIYAPANAFLALYGTAVAGMLFIWAVILLTYLRFRQAMSPDQVAALPIRLPAHRVAAWRRHRRRSSPSPRRRSSSTVCSTPCFSYLPFLLVMSIVYRADQRNADAQMPARR